MDNKNIDNSLEPSHMEYNCLNIYVNNILPVQI